ncbi:hypothetical protein [Neobacillus drentensis]|uniref:hypothetical protein n=2 Tax=Neobacillus drentensis TaxID=220684 RepID=UPI001C3F1D1B|nr:hypothetical protein [Neobacillus drentensis]
MGITYQMKNLVRSATDIIFVKFVIGKVGRYPLSKPPNMMERMKISSYSNIRNPVIFISDEFDSDIFVYQENMDQKLKVSETLQKMNY